MKENDMLENVIESLKKHLSGEEALPPEKLEEIGQDLEASIPYEDDWRSHGYSSYEEWLLEHKDFIGKLDEALELYSKIK